MKYFIVLIFLIFIFSVRFSENFTCNRSLYYSNKIFRPLRMITLNSSNLNGKVNVDSIINKNLINKALEKIPLSYHSNNIYELSHSNYNYKKGFTGAKYNKNILDLLNSKISNILINKISTQIELSYKNLCNKNCKLEFLEYRIKRLGKINDKLVVEGQQLFHILNGSKKFMIEYVVIDNTKMDILHLNLGGIEYKKILENNDDQEKDIIHDKLNILGSPLYGIYNLPKKHLYSSLETSMKPVNKFKNKDKFSYFCYGKKALNKIDCEKIDNSNIRGVWDKSCDNDRECPFYRIGSKNGGCKQGQCEFPIGVDRISPRKYININNALCSGCKYTIQRPNKVDRLVKNGNCCISQMNNRKKYPKLKTPNYIFN